MKAATAGWQKSSKTRTRKQTSDKTLAKDIVASIRAHAEAGTVKTARDYTSRGEIIAMVEALLAK